MTIALTKTKQVDNKTYELFEIAHGLFEVVVTTYTDGKRFIKVSKPHNADYLPEIYCDDDLEGHIFGFKIQTTSYGVLSADEIQKMILGYNVALEVVASLTERFIN